MATTPALSDAGDDDAYVRPRKPKDRRTTWILLVLLYLLCWLLMLAIAVSQIHPTCDENPQSCNKELLNTGTGLMWVGAILVPLVATMVSIALFNRQRRAFYVPLLGTAATVGLAVIGALVQGAGLP